MTKTEVMLSLQKELKEEVLPYYNQVVVRRLEKELLPMVQRSGRPVKKSYEKKTSVLIPSIWVVL